MSPRYLLVIAGLIIDISSAGVGLALSTLSTTIAAISPAAGIGIGAVIGAVIGGITIGGLCIATAGGACVAVALGAAVAGGGTGAAVGNFAGTATGAGVSIFGGMFAYVVATCISIGGGVLLSMLLLYSDAFYPRYVFGAMFGKTVPIVDLLPAWSYCAWRSVRRSEQERLASAASEEPAAQPLPPRPSGQVGKEIAAVAAAVLFFFGVPHAAFAQSMPDPIQVLVAPETPGPNEPVLIEVDGVGSFVGDAKITWTKNGAIASQGTGLSKFSFTTEGLGVATRIGLTIESQTQGTISRSFVFSPSLVNLIWEADTTIPPFSRAKPLYSAGSPLRILAFPVVYYGKTRVAASSLSFHWSIGDNPDTANSGLGKNILSITGDQLQNSEDVSVDVYFGNTKVAHGEASISAVNAGVLLYEKDALRGEITDVAIPQAIALKGKEITLQAEPLYFSSDAKRAGLLQYSWTLNDNDTTGPLSSQGILTLRQTGDGAGSAALGVSVQNQSSDQFVQSANTLLQLVFGQSSSLLKSLFGI